MEHSLNNALCPECDAHWIDGQLYWSNGKEGCPHDLAGLVCNQMFIRSQRRKRIEENATTPTDAINRALMEFEYGSNGSTESQELLQLSSE